MSATVLGLGIVAPGAPDCASLPAALSASPVRPPRVGVVPDGGDAKVRRLPRLERMALAAARQALGAETVTESMALVFGTGYGGLTATVDFLEGLASRGPEFGSPTAFHQSVHHSPAGQLSISLGLRGPSFTVTARELSGETALQLGMELLASGRAEKVLVVAADECVPALEAGYRAFGVLAGAEEADPHRSLEPGEGAAAVLLGTGPGPLRVESCALTAHPCAVLRFARAEQLAPLLRQALEVQGAPVSFSLAAPNAELHEAEVAVLGERLAGQAKEAGAQHFGFHPSAGLMRLVAGALRLGEQPPGAACVLHGLALGGGQALTVVRRAAA
ncbi:MAG: beta-ketoacyl synthase chain length factor [Myxococcaceae bacterium]|nr:beta-ketoacyl synthase chain length factor [Myxococcaceae bacterium]MCI0673313.1 beta-ketoacyl synthase chain length factor [Myxococcaceae bacterium]